MPDMEKSNKSDYPPRWFVALCVVFGSLLCISFASIIQDVGTVEDKMEEMGTPGLAYVCVILECLGVVVFGIGACTASLPSLMPVFLVAMPPVALAQRIVLMTMVGLLYQDGHFERKFGHLGGGGPLALLVVWEMLLFGWFVGYVVFWFFAFRAYKARPQPESVD